MCVCARTFVFMRVHVSVFGQRGMEKEKALEKRIQRGYERIGEQPENEKDNKKGKQQYMSTSSY